jgi:NAD(P)-dependent dehydrogenase (short-subunit alcohol dehydrogenase family)
MGTENSPTLKRTPETGQEMKNPRVVLVTGASSGIGNATATNLAREGWRVFGAARNPPAAHDGSFSFLTVDVRDDRSVHGCVSGVLEEAGRIDVLVNCAGVAVGGSAEEMGAEEITDQIQTNLLGIIRTCRAVLPGMRERGSGLIINLGSLAGLMGVPFQSVYSASKYGVEGFSESLQMEVKDFGIRVVVVDPGDVCTEITAHRRISGGNRVDSPYRQSLQQAMHSQAESEKHGWKVERLAKFVARIVRSRSPRFRYTPGPILERISPIVRRVIPDRLYLTILARFYGLQHSASHARK